MYVFYQLHTPFLHYLVSKSGPVSMIHPVHVCLGARGGTRMMENAATRIRTRFKTWLLPIAYWLLGHG